MTLAISSDAGTYAESRFSSKYVGHFECYASPTGPYTQVAPSTGTRTLSRQVATCMQYAYEYADVNRFMSPLSRVTVQALAHAVFFSSRKFRHASTCHVQSRREQQLARHTAQL